MFVNQRTEIFSKKLGSPVMRQSFPAFCVAFLAALIPPFWRHHRSDRSPPLSVSKQSSTGRLTHSKPDSTVSNSLLLRCLASCLSDGGKEECVQETHQGCPAPIKSTVFRTYSSENLHSETKNAFSSAVLSAFDGRAHTRAAGTAPKTVDLHGASCVQGWS